MDIKNNEGRDVIKKDNSLFGIFMDERFGGFNPEDSYSRGWVDRWNKGIENVWKEGDNTTRAALIEAIERKAKDVHYFKEEELDFTDTSFPITYMFVKNRFGRDLTDSYAQNWVGRFNESVEKTLGQMDTRSLGVLVSILKLKLKKSYM